VSPTASARARRVFFMGLVFFGFEFTELVGLIWQISSDRDGLCALAKPSARTQPKNGSGE